MIKTPVASMSDKKGERWKFGIPIALLHSGSLHVLRGSEYAGGKDELNCDIVLDILFENLSRIWQLLVQIGGNVD
jgi:hypothetical protein